MSDEQHWTDQIERRMHDDGWKDIPKRGEKWDTAGPKLVGYIDWLRKDLRKVKRCKKCSGAWGADEGFLCRCSSGDDDAVPEVEPLWRHWLRNALNAIFYQFASFPANKIPMTTR